MTGEERIKELQRLGWEVVGDDREGGVGEVRLEKKALRKSRDPFGNCTGDDWEQTLHRQIYFFGDGTFEETRG
mgnify:CR=1 FL=1